MGGSHFFSCKPFGKANKPTASSCCVALWGKGVFLLYYRAVLILHNNLLFCFVCFISNSSPQAKTQGLLTKMKKKKNMSSKQTSPCPTPTNTVVDNANKRQRELAFAEVCSESRAVKAFFKIQCYGSSKCKEKCTFVVRLKAKN